MKKETYIAKIRSAAPLALVAAGAAGVFALSLLYAPSAPEREGAAAPAAFGAGKTAVLYKSPNCGCCSGYARALSDAGFRVDVVETDDMESVKDRYGIPEGGESCHTIAIGDYVVEGHVPLEAVARLLSEKPDVDGIGLPRMPSGSPGMPGPKRAPFEVYGMRDGAMEPYMTI